MIKSVILTMNPSQCYSLMCGVKTIDIRKTKPKLKPPFKCYIYCTNSRPLITNGKLFDGDYVTLGGYNKKEAEQFYGFVFNGKIIGEFTCDRVDEFNVFDNGVVQYWNYLNLDKSGFTYEEIANYIRVNKKGYAWHISNLMIYDSPKVLKEDYFTECKCFDIEKCKNCDGYYGGGRYEAPWCTYEGIKPIENPPHSWCYTVEEWW